MAKPDDHYDDQETERRFKATLHKMLRTPHQPHEPAGEGRKSKTAKHPRRQSAPKSAAK
jgi:hypothetical protein